MKVLHSWVSPRRAKRSSRPEFCVVEWLRTDFASGTIHESVHHFRRVSAGAAVTAQQEIEIRMNAQLEIRMTAQTRQQRSIMRYEPGHWYTIFLDEINRIGQHIVMRPVNVNGKIRCFRPVRHCANLDARKSSACPDHISSRVTMLPR